MSTLQCFLCTVRQNSKTCHPTFLHNVWQILHSYKNSVITGISKYLQQYWCNISHHTLNILLSYMYLENYKIAKFLSIQHNNPGLLLMCTKWKHCRWMMWHKLNAKSVLVHKYVHQGCLHGFLRHSPVVYHWWRFASAFKPCCISSIMLIQLFGIMT